MFEQIKYEEIQKYHYRKSPKQLLGCGTRHTNRWRSIKWLRLLVNI